MKKTYKIVCISLYTEDIKKLEMIVARAKANGNPGANKSALIRYALSQIDTSKIPRLRRRGRFLGKT